MSARPSIPCVVALEMIRLTEQQIQALRSSAVVGMTQYEREDREETCIKIASPVDELVSERRGKTDAG